MASNMKRAVLISLLIASVAASAIISSCERDEFAGNLQLLERIVYDCGSYEKFEYDEQNRISKITLHNENGEYMNSTFYTYNGDDLVEKAALGWIDEYAKSKNKITVMRKNSSGNVYGVATIELNSNGLPVRHEETSDGYYVVMVSQYQGGNTIKNTREVTHNGDYRKYCHSFKYDRKKMPHHHCKTPRWYIYWQHFTSGRNNVVEITYCDNSRSRMKYKYDRAGFPTKRTIIFSNGHEIVTEYKYK